MIDDHNSFNCSRINNAAAKICEGDCYLFLNNDVWREMFDFSDDAVLLVLASEVYDESDYIRDYEQFLEYVKTRRKNK